MTTVQHLTFNELSERLRGFERKYGYSTIEFYRRFQGGELGDDDDVGRALSSVPHVAANAPVYAK